MKSIHLAAVVALMSSAACSTSPSIPGSCSDSSDCAGPGQYCDAAAGLCVSDRVPPSIAISEPSAARVFSLADPQVARLAGVVQDNGSGVDKVEVFFSDIRGWQPVDSLQGQGFGAGWSLPDVDAKDLTAKVRASDEAGNTSDAVSVTVRVDRVAPALTVDAPTQTSFDAQSAGKDVALAGSSADGSGQVTVSLQDNQQPISGTASGPGAWSLKWIPPVNDNGVTHVVSVTARDAAGNESVAAVGTFFVDGVPPSVTITNPSDGEILGLAAPSPYRIAGTFADGTNPVAPTLTLKLDGIDVSAQATVTASTGDWWYDFPLALEDGQGHVIKAEAKDPAGNLTTVTHTFFVDRVPSRTTIIGPTATVFNKADAVRWSNVITFTGTTVDGSSGAALPKKVHYQLDADPEATLAPTTATWSLPYVMISTDNSVVHTLKIWGEDLAGNLEAPLTKIFTVDVVPPMLIASSIGKRLVPLGSVAFTFSEPIDQASVTASSVAFSPAAAGVAASFPTPAALSISGLAPYTKYGVNLTSMVTDKAGNPLAAQAGAFLTAPNPVPNGVIEASSGFASKIAVDRDGNPFVLALSSAGALTLWHWSGSAWSTAAIFSTNMTTSYQNDSEPFDLKESDSIAADGLTLNWVVGLTYAVFNGSSYTIHHDTMTDAKIFTNTWLVNGLLAKPTPKFASCPNVYCTERIVYKTSSQVSYFNHTPTQLAPYSSYVYATASTSINAVATTGKAGIAWLDGSTVFFDPDFAKMALACFPGPCPAPITNTGLAGGAPLRLVGNGILTFSDATTGLGRLACGSGATWTSTLVPNSDQAVWGVAADSTQLKVAANLWVSPLGRGGFPRASIETISNLSCSVGGGNSAMLPVQEFAQHASVGIYAGKAMVSYWNGTDLKFFSEP